MKVRSHIVHGMCSFALVAAASVLGGCSSQASTRAYQPRTQTAPAAMHDAALPGPAYTGPAQAGADASPAAVNVAPVVLGIMNAEVVSTFAVQFNDADVDPAHAEDLAMVQKLKQLTFRNTSDGVKATLGEGDLRLTGEADPGSARHWSVGLGGFDAAGAPLVMRMNVEQSGAELRGSIVMDSNGKTFTSFFVAIQEGPKRIVKLAPRGSNATTHTLVSPAGAPGATKVGDTVVSSDTHYHLPDGIH